MTLVSDRSFPTRREAIESISEAEDLAALSENDVFLVDLDAAAPVAIVPCREDDQAAAEPPSAGVEGARPPADDESEESGQETVSDAAGREAEEALEPDDGFERAVLDLGGSLGVVQIDIDAWTCEDCIYVSTCAYTGTRRPAQCGAFQWRA
jgi:hypothetical protein